MVTLTRSGVCLAALVLALFAATPSGAFKFTTHLYTANIAMQVFTKPIYQELAASIPGHLRLTLESTESPRDTSACGRTPLPDLYGQWKRTVLGEKATDDQLEARVESQRPRVEALPDPFGRLVSLNATGLAASGELVLWRDADLIVLVDKLSSTPEALVVPKRSLTFPSDAPAELVRRMAFVAAATADALLCSAPEAQQRQSTARIYVNPPERLSVSRFHVHVQPRVGLSGITNPNGFYGKVREHLGELLGSAPEGGTSARHWRDKAGDAPGPVDLLEGAAGVGKVAIDLRARFAGDFFALSAGENRLVIWCLELDGVASNGYDCGGGLRGDWLLGVRLDGAGLAVGECGDSTGHRRVGPVQPVTPCATASGHSGPPLPRFRREGACERVGWDPARQELRLTGEAEGTLASVRYAVVASGRGVDRAPDAHLRRGFAALAEALPPFAGRAPAIDQDGDGHTSMPSCGGSRDDSDDQLSTRFPGAPEKCDHSDSNCDGHEDPSCGNLIGEVTVSKARLCPGEATRISVSARDHDRPIQFRIMGMPGESRWVQFRGASPGERRVNVMASSLDGFFDTRTAVVTVDACPDQKAEEKAPYGYVRGNLYHHNTVDFGIENLRDLDLRPGWYVKWNFGDGSPPLQTKERFVSHDYTPAIPRDSESVSFEAVGKIVNPAGPTREIRKTVTLWNAYALDKKRRIVRPPVEVPERAQLLPNGFARVTYSVRNLEDYDLYFVSRWVELQPCDPDDDPQLTRMPDQSLLVPAHGGVERTFELVVKPNVCGIAEHLRGVGGKGVPRRIVAAVDVYSEVRDNLLLVEPERDAGIAALLNQVVEQQLLGADVRTITDEDLYVLSRRGRIADRPPTIEEPPTGGVAPPPPPPEFEEPGCRLAAGPCTCEAGQPCPCLGQPCDPGDTAPRVGVTCQATSDWCIDRRPYLPNALKGDVLIVSACSFMGKLFRAVSQIYTHEGIMTRNYDELSHSTSAEERYTKNVIEGPSTEGGPFIRERVMRFGFPGALHETVGTAFYGHSVYDPDNNASDPGDDWFVVDTFSPNATKCDGDSDVAPMLVIKPPIQALSDGSIRAGLHAAADEARSSSGHYRFFGFTEGQIANVAAFADPSDLDERATVSTTFIWGALNRAGVSLEKPELTSNERLESGLDIDGFTQDGLYLYPEPIRIPGVHLIFDQTHNAVVDLEGAVAEIADAPDNLGNQLTNCFVSDACDADAAESEAWKDPGEGRSVSPDNFRALWDKPAGFGEGENGHYGYNEYLVFRNGQRTRQYRWAASAGTGTISGLVTVEGVALADGHTAQVVLDTDPPLVATTGPGGAFVFDAVPATSPGGSYHVAATLPLSQTGDIFMSGEVFTDVLADSIRGVTIDLTRPPDYLREVVVFGQVDVIDDEAPYEDETKTLTFRESCQVDPFRPIHQVQWTSECVGKEVKAELDFQCELQPDLVSVKVLGKIRLFEGDTCEFERDSRNLSCGPGNWALEGAEELEDFECFERTLAPLPILGRDITDPSAQVFLEPTLTNPCCDDQAAFIVTIANGRQH